MRQMIEVVIDFYTVVFQQMPLLGLLWIFIPFLVQFFICMVTKKRWPKWILPMCMLLFTVFFLIMVQKEGGYAGWDGQKIALHYLGCMMWPIHAAMFAGLGGLTARLIQRRSRATKET